MVRNPPFSQRFFVRREMLGAKSFDLMFSSAMIHFGPIM